MLDGLAAARGGAEGDGAGDEEDELAGGGALEVAEVADVGGVGQHDGLLLPGGGGGGGTAWGFEHQQRRDLHRGIRQGREVPWTRRVDAGDAPGGGVWCGGRIWRWCVRGNRGRHAIAYAGRNIRCVSGKRLENLIPSFLY